MMIVVVGAAGNVGSRVVNAALALGEDVVTYVRRPEAVSARAGLTVVQGDAADVAALAAAAKGADAVIVSITGPMKDRAFMQRTLPKVIESVRQAKAGRLVLVSAFGAGDTADKASPLMRFVYRRVRGAFFRDKAAADQLLLGSGLEYSIVYPVNLKDAPALPSEHVAPLEQVAKVPGIPTLPFDNAARAIVGIAGDPKFAGARVLVTTPTGWKSS